jgi:hypothetical protein
MIGHQVISMNYFHELGPLFFSVLELVVRLWLPISFHLVCNFISALVVNWILFYILKRCVQDCLEKFVFPFGYITNVHGFIQDMKFSQQCWWRLISWDVIMCQLVTIYWYFEASWGSGIYRWVSVPGLLGPEDVNVWWCLVIKMMVVLYSGCCCVKLS